MDLKFSLSNINGVAKEIATMLEKNKVVALHGDMGAGKTTLVHAICESLGVTDTVGSVLSSGLKKRLVFFLMTHSTYTFFLWIMKPANSQLICNL